MKKRKKRKKLTEDESYIKNVSLTGYPFLDGIIYIAGLAIIITYASDIKAFFDYISNALIK